MTHRHKTRRSALLCLFSLGAFAATTGCVMAGETWRGLAVAPEQRCSPYRPDDYRYPASVEPLIAAELGPQLYSPYTGERFASLRESDIEHIVARSERTTVGSAPHRRHAPAFQRRPPQPHTGIARAQPPPQTRPRCRRLAATDEPLLVRPARARGAAKVRPHHRRREAAVLEGILGACASTTRVMPATSGERNRH